MARATAQSAQRFPLSYILGTDAGVRLLRELLRHGGQLAPADLVLRTQLAKASVARGLAALVSIGVVQAAGRGRSVLYGARAEHPLYPALAALFEAEEARFQAILEAARRAAREAGPGVVALWLYGSVAGGKDRPDSDLDLAVVAEPGMLATVADRMRDGLVEPGRRIGFTPSVVAIDSGDVVRLMVENDPWWRSIIWSATALVGKDPLALASALARKGMAS